MNKYLEKIAKIDPVKAWVGGGALAGAALGGYYGSSETKKVPVSPWRTTEVKLTTPERILHSVGGSINGAVLGATAGGMIAARRHPDRFSSHFGEAFKGRSHGNSGGYQRGQSNGGYGRTYASRTIHDIHGDLGMPKGGFKTKKEATDHFRRMRSKHHPDRAKTEAEKVTKHSEMSKLNKAWDDFQKHPEGFTKLANAYLEKAAAIKTRTIQVSLPILFGGLGAADGILSTEKRNKDTETRFRLRQLRKAIGYGAAGAGAGFAAQHAIRKILA